MVFIFRRKELGYDEHRSITVTAPSFESAKFVANTFNWICENESELHDAIKKLTIDDVNNEGRNSIIEVIRIDTMENQVLCILTLEKVRCTLIYYLNAKKNMEEIEMANLYLKTKNKYLRVMGELDESLTPDNYIDGKGYSMENGRVWIFNKSCPKKDVNKFPNFWYDENKGAYRYSNPEKSVAEEFDVEKAASVNLEVVTNETVDGEVLYDPEMIRDMNAAAEIYHPYIKEEDDFLTQLIKTIILAKHVDVSQYKSKVDSKYILNNLITALDGDTKMSMKYFAIWKELLGFDFTMEFWGNGQDKDAPLTSFVTYDSTTCKVEVSDTRKTK